MIRLSYILLNFSALSEKIENLKCAGSTIRYYPGNTCSSYWLCFDGYQYPGQKSTVFQ